MDNFFSFQSCETGDVIPESKIGPISNLQLVKWAAGSGDFNPIHFDLNVAKKQGLENVLVHGPYKYAFAAKVLMQMLGQNGHIIRLSSSYKGMDISGNTLAFTGTITDVQQTEEGRVVKLNYTLNNQKGIATVNGSAVVMAK